MPLVFKVNVLWCRGAPCGAAGWVLVNDYFMDNPYYRPCSQKGHYFPPSPVREMCEGVPGRPKLPSGAVFACNLTGEPTGLVTCLPWPSSSVCRA